MPLLVRNLDHHAVIGRNHILRQFLAQGRIIEIIVHIRQYGALGFHTCDPFQRLGQVEMRGMGPASQRINNPNIEIFEIFQAL